MLGKRHERQPGQFPYVSLALSSNSFHQSVLTGLCMSAPHHDILKHLGRYITCVVVFADFNRLGLLLPALSPPIWQTFLLCTGLGPAQRSCWFPVAKDGCSLSSCPGPIAIISTNCLKLFTVSTS